MYWVTQAGGLTGFAYRYPDSGDFQIRAVFLNDRADRVDRAYLEDRAISPPVPEATPAP